ncbi:sugar transferase [Campylobacter jejuni]|uniref:sugar transferase n=1 Tax=Campylobacter jejuni TaxID=197 RepID=UPI0009A939C5|nr:sugar transferase [Campylobacter jejuni]
MHCPLCQSENDQKELFKTLNVFTSSGKLDKNPTQIKTTITTNDDGGGIVKVTTL